MSLTYCPKCNQWMKNVKGGHVVITHDKKMLPSSYNRGDLLECPTCHIQVISGFGNKESAPLRVKDGIFHTPASEIHFEDEFTTQSLFREQLENAVEDMGKEENERISKRLEENERIKKKLEEIDADPTEDIDPTTEVDANKLLKQLDEERKEIEHIKRSKDNGESYQKHFTT